MSAPTELLVGPEPPQLPAGAGRFGWLGRHRAPILWLAAVGTFLLSTQLLVESGRLWEIFVPPVAALIALPLGLAAATPLRAWRLQVVVAAATPLLVPPEGWVGPPWLPTLVFVAMYVTYTVAVRLDLHLLVGVWVVTDATIVFGYLATGAGVNALNQAYVGILLATVLIALGYLTGTRRRLTFELIEGRRREQEERAHRTLLEERARIARELHDVVAHHMSVITVQAETAPLPDRRAAGGRQALARSAPPPASRSTEMRRLLGVLREDAETRGERAPQPGLGELTELVDAGAAPAVTERRARSRRRPAPAAAGVELSAYRIVQEALTNVVRHAPGAAAGVGLAARARAACVVAVRDTAARSHGPATAATGHGLRRHARARHACRRQARHRPRRDGGFRVGACPAPPCRRVTTPGSGNRAGRR